MYGPHPVISAAHVRDHYMGLEVFKPESSSGVGGPEATSPRTTADAPSFLQTAQRLVREEGLSALAQQVWRYLRC
jgi:hypothetical protein